MSEKLIRDVYAAFNRGDVPELAKLSDQDMVMVVPGDTAISGRFEGHQEIFGALGAMASTTGGTSRAEIVRLLADDEGAVVIAIDHSFRNGMEITAEYADVFRTRQGRVTELRFFPADPDAMAAYWATETTPARQAAPWRAG